MLKKHSFSLTKSSAVIILSQLEIIHSRGFSNIYPVKG